jgi:hypothetical protein
MVHITNLAGSNFQTGATVKLTRSGQSDINATNVVWVSASQIACDLDLTGAATGQWNVVVTNPDPQSGTLSNGFTVSGAPNLVCLPLVLKNAGPPSAPVLSDISNPDGDGNYTVSWSAVSGATSYTLEEDDNAAFSSPATVYSGSGTSKSITGKGMGTYYYRVKAVNPLGSSNWSGVKSVTVYVLPPPCPQTGAWSGTTSYGDPISFTVSSIPICQVRPLTITMFVFCSGWPGYRYETVGFDYSMPISGNQFGTGPGFEEVVGSFTSSTTVTGTWHYSDFECHGSGTWTANP